MADNEATGTITLHIKTSKTKETVVVEPTATIKELKETISSKFNAPVEQLCLIFAGRILKDHDTLETYSLKDGLTIHLVIKSENKAQQQAASHAAQSRPSQPSTTPPPAPSASQTRQTGTPSSPNPFGLGGLGSLGGMDTSQGSFQQLQQQLLSNPDMMRQLMENPMVQSMMSDPDLMRQLILSNPQIQQLMERNPELSHILNNPELMRQTMEMARNPSLMQEMMRSQDRAMSNLESLPGGFNALQRMYTDIQEPMLNAAQEQLQQAQSNPFSALFGNQGNTAANPQRGTENTSPLPNPWAPPGQNAASPPAPRTTPLATTQPATRQSATTQTATTQSATTQTATTQPATTQPANSTTNTESSTTPSAPSSQAPPSASGVFQSPGMQSLAQQMLGNPQLMQNMMQSPYMQQMMDQMTQNPDLMANMMRTNPLFQSNPQLAEEFRARLPELVSQMRNPDVRQAMSNPRVMQAIMQIQQGMQQLREEAPGLVPGASGGLGGMGGAPTWPPAASTSSSAPPAGSSSTPTPPSTTTAPIAGMTDEQWGNLVGHLRQAMSQGQNPEERYRPQLEQLAAMGFVDRAKNIQALVATGGDVNMAIERLLNETQTHFA